MTDAPDDDGWTRPSVYIQYKNTDICIDFHCLCDTEHEPTGMGHYDGYHAYAVKCGRCGRIYELPTELPLKLVESTHFTAVVIKEDKEW